MRDSIRRFLLTLPLTSIAILSWSATHVSKLEDVEFHHALKCIFVPSGMEPWESIWLLNIESKKPMVWEKNIGEGWNGHDAGSDSEAIYWGDTNFGTYEFNRKTQAIHSGPGKLSNISYDGQCTLIPEARFREG